MNVLHFLHLQDLSDEGVRLRSHLTATAGTRRFQANDAAPACSCGKSGYDMTVQL